MERQDSNVIPLYPDSSGPVKSEQESRKRPSLVKKRVYAFTVDLFVISIINKMMVLAYSSFLKTTFLHLSSYTQNRLIEGLITVNFSILLLTFWGYFFLSYYLAQGQTPGKLLFNLRVYSKYHNNSPELSFLEGITRTCGYFFCYTLGIILLSIPLFRKDRRGIPDWISGTFVETEDYLKTLEIIPTNIQEQPVPIQLSLFTKEQLAIPDTKSSGHQKAA